MADNNRDKKEKGRSNRGERHGHAKLTEDDVVVIRGEYAGGRMTQAEIAARYGVAPSQVSMVVNRRTWGHVA
jgi:DNA-directed RNA polymerase specialized sigma subunit